MLIVVFRRLMLPKLQSSVLGHRKIHGSSTDFARWAGPCSLKMTRLQFSQTDVIHHMVQRKFNCSEVFLEFVGHFNHPLTSYSRQEFTSRETTKPSSAHDIGIAKQN